MCDCLLNDEFNMHSKGVCTRVHAVCSSSSVLHDPLCAMLISIIKNVLKSRIIYIYTYIYSYTTFHVSMPLPHVSYAPLAYYFPLRYGKSVSNFKFRNVHNGRCKILLIFRRDIKVKY